jgi:hypothetical protein
LLSTYNALPFFVVHDRMRVHREIDLLGLPPKLIQILALVIIEFGPKFIHPREQAQIGGLVLKLLLPLLLLNYI